MTQIETYINNFDGITKDRLIELYNILKPQLPNAKEKISYGVPTFYNEKGPIVYFAGYADFVSIYPVHRAAKLQSQIKPYLSGKSTARFAHSKPLPTKLITKLTLELAKVNQANKKPKVV